MWQATDMLVKAVQVSMELELLRRVDSQPETRQHGRSAFVRSAIESYLRANERREVDEAIARAYGGRADAMLAEVEGLLGAQAWPDD